MQRTQNKDSEHWHLIFGTHPVDKAQLIVYEGQITLLIDGGLIQVKLWISGIIQRAKSRLLVIIILHLDHLDLSQLMCKATQLILRYSVVTCDLSVCHLSVVQ